MVVTLITMKNTDDTRKAVKARKKVLAKKDPLADWKDPEDHRFHVLDRYHEKREAFLPKDRKCPDCGELKVESNKWIVSKSGKCLCRACFQRLSKVKEVLDLPTLKEAFEEVPRFTINSSVLADNLISLGLSGREFGRRVGVSQSYVNKLLNDQIPTIGGEMYDTIQTVFNERITQIRKDLLTPK